MYKRSVFIFAITLALFVSQSYSQVVCSQDELIKELYEDVIDNGNNRKLFS